MKIAPATLLVSVIALGMAGHVDAAGSSCDSLLNLALENATVTSAELVAG
jgi:hypothetical protein